MMAMHLEYVVPGPPISNQQRTARGKSNLAIWRAAVLGAAARGWANPLLGGDLKAIVINFYIGDGPTVDLDNMSKPILDAMTQVVQAELIHLKLDADYSIEGTSHIIAEAIHEGRQFVYVRIDDPVDPFPLP